MGQSFLHDFRVDYSITNKPDVSHANINEHVHSDAGTIRKCIAKCFNQWASHPKGISMSASANITEGCYF